MDDRRLARLRWRCRRGLLELDLILGAIVETRYADLGESQRLAFERLLTVPDQTLLAYLQGHEAAPDAELCALLEVLQRPGS